MLFCRICAISGLFLPVPGTDGRRHQSRHNKRRSGHLRSTVIRQPGSACLTGVASIVNSLYTSTSGPRPRIVSNPAPAALLFLTLLNEEQCEQWADGQDDIPGKRIQERCACPHDGEDGYDECLAPHNDNKSGLIPFPSTRRCPLVAYDQLRKVNMPAKKI